MATVGTLDFQSYVNAKWANRASEQDGRDDERAYCYVSDRNTRKTFETMRPVQLVIDAVVRLMRSVGRNELLGTAVKVGPNQFPRVHSLGVECAETLGIATPTIYIRNNPTINAYTYGTNDDAFIMIHSALVDHFDDDELRSVIGHECGHIHNDHVVYLTAIHYLTNMASMLIKYAAAPAQLALRSWSRRAEITCDRASMLCTRSLETSTRALAKIALGSTKLYNELNLEAYLEQYEEGQQGVGKVAEVWATHPWLPKRVKALRAFSESKLFREHIGESGGLSMDAVDEKVHGIIKVLG